MLINIRRDVLVAPHSHGSTALVSVWGMGGRCMDLPRYQQDQAIVDLQALHPWPSRLRRAYQQLNGLPIDAEPEEEQECSTW